VVVTAPRRGDPLYLLDTLASLAEPLDTYNNPSTDRAVRVRSAHNGYKRADVTSTQPPREIAALSPDLFHVVVYTGFTPHPGYSMAQARYGGRANWHWAIEGIEQSASIARQRVDFAAALTAANKVAVRCASALSSTRIAAWTDAVLCGRRNAVPATPQPARYYVLVEDDFPFCEGGWDEFTWLLTMAADRVPDHCGVFIATGGRYAARTGRQLKNG